MGDNRVSNDVQLWTIFTLLSGFILIMFFAFFENATYQGLKMANREIFGLNSLSWYLLVCPIWATIAMAMKKEGLSRILRILLYLSAGLFVFFLFTLEIYPKIALLFISSMLSILLVDFFLKMKVTQLFFLCIFLVGAYSLFLMQGINCSWSHGIIWSLAALSVFGILAIVIFYLTETFIFLSFFLKKAIKY